MFPFFCTGIGILLTIGTLFKTGVGTGTFTLKDVLYGTAACPNDDNNLRRPIKVAAGVKVRVTRYNMDNQSMGLNSFINGLER